MTIQVSPVSDGATINGKLRGDRTAYLSKLLNLPQQDLKKFHALSTEAYEALAGLRDRATARVQELAIPSTKDEEWRFTDLSPLLQVNFQSVAGRVASPSLQLSDIEPFALSEAEGSRLVFVDGVYAPTLSSISAIPDKIVVGSLRNGIAQSRWVNYLAKQQGSEEVFTALNTSHLDDAAVLWIPKHLTVEVPIHLLFISTSAIPIISHPRCLVIAESGSSIKFIEEFTFINEGVYFSNPVTEIWIEENAQVNHTRIQRDSQEAFHISKTAVSQARDSRYTCNAISHGAKLSRHNLEVYQTGEQTETKLNGLTMIGDEQLADTHSLISFTKPHGTSHQVHKCIVDDRAHAVFNGKIFVPKPAQLTDAGQLSSTLLLSEKARIDTKPQLEITADNVKCSHGATVSQLDSDEVFYLQSRGINAETSRRLLTYAFAYDVLKEIPVPSLRNTLAQYVREHF
ncbi:MAG: Fe-S cluster assembly protein SufD [Kovacikia sp.]